MSPAVQPTATIAGREALSRWVNEGGALSRPDTVRKPPLDGQGAIFGIALPFQAFREIDDESG